jgi:hypothetical protein
MKNRRLLTWITWAVLASLSVGCSGRVEALLSRIAPEEVDELAKFIIRELHAGEIDLVLPLLSSDLLQIEGVKDQLKGMSQRFAPGEIVEIKLVGANEHSVSRPGRPTHTRRALTYQVRLSEGWSLVAISLERRGEVDFVNGVSVQATEQSLQALNAFTLHGKPVSHLLFLLVGISVAAFSVFAAVRVGLTSMPRRWLWVFVALVGVVSVGLNWSTGEFTLRLLTFQLLSAGVVRQGLVGPWLVSASIPVGAFVALRMRARTMRRRKSAS